METVIELLRRDPNLSRRFRDALAAVPNESREVKLAIAGNIVNSCPECGMPGDRRHARACSQYLTLPEVPYGADGFVRDTDGRIDGLNAELAVKE